jgi:hypothetical protein
MVEYTDELYPWSRQELDELWNDHSVFILRLAIIANARDVLLDPHAHVTSLAVEWDWFFGDSPRDLYGRPEPFSFEAICQSCGLDMSDVRHRINAEMVALGVDKRLDENLEVVRDKRAKERVRHDPSLAVEVQGGPVYRRLVKRDRGIEVLFWRALLRKFGRSLDRAKAIVTCQQGDLFGTWSGA